MIIPLSKVIISNFFFGRLVHENQLKALPQGIFSNNIKLYEL